MKTFVVIRGGAIARASVAPCSIALASIALASIALTSCQHPAAPAHDGGTAAATATATATATDGVGDKPLAAPADKPSTHGESPSTAVTADAASAPSESGTPVRATAFDRILAKPNDPNADPASLKAVVEKATGAHVVTARKTAVHWMLFTLEPSSPPRNGDDQQRAIDAIKGSGAFSAVEADRIMKAQ